MASIDAPFHDDAVRAHAEAVRQFNRFYTRHIGVLQEHLLSSGWSLTEARVLYELAQRPGMSMSELCRELGLDLGYLSRVVSGFEKQGLVSKSRSQADARVTQIALTEAGQAEFAPLDLASRSQVVAGLRQLTLPARQRLVAVMGEIQELLGARAPGGYVLRDPRPGDMGQVVARQAEVYAQEYGWNSEYEALVAEIVARYLREHDQTCERCWIADMAGQPVGSVFLVREDLVTARLRLLHVDPAARGLGIGQHLVNECLRFAKQAGYQRICLWTNSVLVQARRLYERTGFKLVSVEAHHSFGQDLVGQTWAREL